MDTERKLTTRAQLEQDPRQVWVKTNVSPRSVTLYGVKLVRWRTLIATTGTADIVNPERLGENGNECGGRFFNLSRTMNLHEQSDTSFTRFQSKSSTFIVQDCGTPTAPFFAFSITKSDVIGQPNDETGVINHTIPQPT